MSALYATASRRLKKRKANMPAHTKSVAIPSDSAPAE